MDTTEISFEKEKQFSLIQGEKILVIIYII